MKSYCYSHHSLHCQYNANIALFYHCLSQKKEVNTILGDIIKHMTPDRAFEQHYPQVSH